MEKNVTIIDESGNVIGETYPKRAKGLVKKGRAEYVNDFTIKMPDTHVPTVAYDNDNTEVRYMSKVIGFEARGFQIDPTCKGNNIANRMFVTDALGNNVEVYEIGDYGSNWTQISYEMSVEKNEDFEFLFAMTGDIDANNNQSAKCNFIIMPIHEADPDKDWDNRYQYSLLHRDYKPTMEKVWNGSSIRFYRIPFNTGDADKIRFVFVAFQRPYKVFPVKNFEEYKALEDFNSGCGWQNFKNDFKRDFKRDFKYGPGNFGGDKWQNQGWYTGPKDFKEAEKVMSNIGAVVSKAVKEALEGLDKIQKENFGKWQNGPKADNRQNRNYYSSKNSDFDRNPEQDSSKTAGTTVGNRKIYPDHLTQILRGLEEDDGELDLQGCDIGQDLNFIPGKEEDECIVDNITFKLDNAVIDGDAFWRIMAKVGDGCTVNGNNACIGRAGHGPELAGGFGSRSDEVTFNFVNAQISEAAFISIISKAGDGCTINLTNASIEDFEDIQDLSGFCYETFDDTEIRLDNATISQRLYQALVKCCGDDSKIVGRAAII